MERVYGTAEEYRLRSQGYTASKSANTGSRNHRQRRVDVRGLGMEGTIFPTQQIQWEAPSI